MNRLGRWLLIALVLVAAGCVRGCQLGEAPPGLSHDEIINGLVARDILSGHHAIYFTTAGLEGPTPLTTGGHEPLFQYAQAASVGLFGENWMGIRWPSFALGLLGVAAVYALLRRLFDVPTALLAGAWLSISFWPIFYARVGLRAISLPFVAALFGIFFLRAFGTPARRPSAALRPWVLAGLMLGLSLYTYMAARVLPLIAAVSIVYLRLTWNRDAFPWAKVLQMGLVAAFVAAPLVIWLAAHPAAEGRILEVREPLDRLLAGDPSLVWRNLVANLAFFTFVGDPWFHQGVPGRPVFADPISGALFLAGVAIAVWRWRRPRYGLLLVWMLGALVPSILSSHAPPGLASDAPSSIRDILAVVPTFAFPAIAVTEGARWLGRRLGHRELLGRLHLLVLAGTVLLLPGLGLTVRDYFAGWARRPDVRYLYQDDLTAVGHQLDTMEPGTALVVGGLSVTSLDRATLAFSARSTVDEVRLCDPRQTLIVPGSYPANLLLPQVVPFDEDGDLRNLLRGWSETELHPDFTQYALRDRQPIDVHLGQLRTEVTLPDGTWVGVPVLFEDRLTLLGYEWTRAPRATADDASLITYWRVESKPELPLKVFVHVVEGGGTLVAQHDGLASPPQGWMPGDLIVQRHALELAPGTSWQDTTVQVGLYRDIPEGTRLRALTADYLLLSYSAEGQNG